MIFTFAHLKFKTVESDGFKFHLVAVAGAVRFPIRVVIDIVSYAHTLFSLVKHDERKQRLRRRIYMTSSNWKLG